MNPNRFPDLGDLRVRACLAAYRSFSQLNHVLHQLWTPRHPPYTLSNLPIILYSVRYQVFPIHLVFKERPELGSRLNLLSTDDVSGVVEAKGLEPTTAWLQTRCSTN